MRLLTALAAHSVRRVAGVGAGGNHPAGGTSSVMLVAVTLFLVAASAPPAMALDCGDPPVNGSIDAAGEEDVFTFTGSTGDNVVVTIVQDGTWPSFPGPQALVFEPGNPTPFQVVTDSWAFTLFNSNTETGIGPFSQVFSSIMAGTSAGRVRYEAVIGDFPPPVSAIFVQPALFGAFGPGGTNTLFPGTPAGSPLVPIVNDGANDNDEGNAVFQGIDALLSEEQEARLGCGTLQFSDCDGAVAPGPDGVLGTGDDTLAGGVDLAKADASVLLQSFPRFEGTEFDPNWDTADPTLPQPGTVDAAFNDGPGGGVDAPDSRPGEVETGPADVLQGAHYDPAAFADVLANAAANGVTVDPWVIDNLAAYDVAVDGSVACASPTGCRRHPFTGQLFSSELAIVSWNLLMLATGLGAVDNAVSLAVMDRAQPLALGRCSFRQPQYCAFVSDLAAHLTQGGNVRLPSDGTYTILVRASDPSATGPYVLELTCPTSTPTPTATATATPTPTATPSPTPTPTPTATPTATPTPTPPPWDGKTVCHEGKKTKRFTNAKTALKHIAHGDTRGVCR